MHPEEIIQSGTKELVAHLPCHGLVKFVVAEINAKKFLLVMSELFDKTIGWMKENLFKVIAEVKKVGRELADILSRGLKFASLPSSNIPLNHLASKVSLQETKRHQKLSKTAEQLINAP